MFNSSSKGCIYLIADENNQVYKIGASRNGALKRMKQLQTGNANELKLIFEYCCNYPYRLETILHRKFSHKKVHNEWYKIPLRFIMKYSLSLDEVHNFEKTCQEVDNIIEVMKDNIFFAKNLH